MAYAPVTVNFPDSSHVFQNQPNELRYVEGLAKQAQSELQARTRDDVARPSVLLLGPDSSVWALYIDELGVVTTVKVRG